MVPFLCCVFYSPSTACSTPYRKLLNFFSCAFLFSLQVYLTYVSNIVIYLILYLSCFPSTMILTCTRVALWTHHLMLLVLLSSGYRCPSILPGDGAQIALGLHCCKECLLGWGRGFLWDTCVERQSRWVRVCTYSQFEKVGPDAVSTATSSDKSPTCLPTHGIIQLSILPFKKVWSAILS